MRINYDFDGTIAKDLVVLDANGKITKDSNGNIVTEEKAINSSNGYDVARQIGKLYAMQFIEKLITNVNYYNKDAFTGSFTHTVVAGRIGRRIYRNGKSRFSVRKNQP